MVFWSLVGVVAAVLTSLGAAAGAEQQGPLPAVGGMAPAIVATDVVVSSSDVKLDPSKGDILAQLRGHVVVAEFFGTWCGPCVDGIEKMNTLANELADTSVVFLKVSEEPTAALKKFAESRKMGAVLLSDTSGQTYRSYYLRNIPFVVIVDARGVISGFTNPEMITKEMVLAAVK